MKIQFLDATQTPASAILVRPVMPSSSRFMGSESAS